ncbi:MAG: DUF4062 domain-containing protein [Gemmatimonadales bacterium]|jgi:hypothetical protein
MPYGALVYNVMIASPSDVAKERQIVRDVVLEWNAINSKDRGVVLAPVAWETHASPEMGDRAQAIINKQLLHDCDILVAVFWTRLGSPTGESSSGTVEEINEHIAANRPALIYFSDEPVHPSSVHEGQYRALREFKAECTARGLYESYSTITEFREKIARQLAQTVIRTFPARPQAAPAAPNAPPPPPLPAISADARELLLAAADDPRGLVMHLRVMGGPLLQTNSREFIEQASARSAARWMAAQRELQQLGLLEDRSGKGEIYYVTLKGFDTADRLVGMRPN